MAGQSNGRGQDLLDLFIRSGCNEASTDDIRGEDLGKKDKFISI